MENKWKIIAIIFIVLFTLENLIILYGVVISSKEIKNTNICYYEFCKDYIDAIYDEGVCTCYEYDMIGELIPVDYKLIG